MSKWWNSYKFKFILFSTITIIIILLANIIYCALKGFCGKCSCKCKRQKTSKRKNKEVRVNEVRLEEVKDSMQHLDETTKKLLRNLKL